MEKLDILNRESFIEQLVQLTERIADNQKSVSFAINGKWGCGKSFVLDMFDEQLGRIQSEETSSDKYLIVRYNCWKYDYYEEPLIAIVSTIIDTINEKTKLLQSVHGEKIKGVLKAVGATLLSIPNSALKNATGIDIKEAYSVVKSGIDNGNAEYKKMQEYDMYFSFSQTLRSLQNVLNEISEQYTLVFLIDELDRCLPEYSIKVLERLHHLTENTKKVINIIVIDKGQLQTSIQHVLGIDNADEYLKKFIQFAIPLDNGIASEKIIEKYSEYIALFDKSILSVEDSIEEFMQVIFRRIEIREQEQIMHKAMLIHQLLYQEAKDYSFMCIEVLMIVLSSCYMDKKCFSKWFTKFTDFTQSSIENPPFSAFFENKFSKIPNGEIEHWGSVHYSEYVFKVSDSLYGAIAYTWYKMFFNHPERVISIIDKSVENLLNNNVADLKKFLDTLKLIK